MRDIGEWLTGLGLGRYLAVFVENEIDLAALPHLTETDLRELGLPMGPRKKLLASIAEFAPGAGEVETRSESAAGRVERRQLTVLFCDLVGSTALSQRLDPEDYREVIRRFQETCAGLVREHGGYVAKHLGDGLLAYFGYPQAGEDDGERAVRAALALTRAVAALEAGAALKVRSGLETGLVVAGDLSGAGLSQPDEITGETPNLAARLQQGAAPGEVVVGPTLRRVLGAAFTIEALGARALKGIARPVEVYRVVGEARRESRFEARQAGKLTAFVGRGTELHTLMERWREAAAGEGQVVLISGEPGIGKSRLVHEFWAGVAGEPHTRLRYQCSPQHMNSALYPMIVQLGFAAGIEPEEPAASKLDKLEALIRQGGGSIPAVAPLFADLMSIPQEGRYPALNYSPQRQREEMFAALLAQLAGLAAGRPVLAIFEDVHWIDPTTRELLDLMVERIAGLPVLALITFRPEFQAPWVGMANVTPLALARMNKRLTAALTASVAGTATLPEKVIADIAAKTEGVPLFVEELTKAVLEAGSVSRVPPTLKDSLAARLDRLGSAREVAQIGAVLGRSFPHGLLAAVSGFEPAALGDALRHLIDAELLFHRGTPPDVLYTFKHALIQDAAYESLIKTRRRELHARAAETLAEHFPETRESAPELLAHHCTEAASFALATGFWLAAATRALQHSASQEAVQHATRGLATVSNLEDSEAKLHQELALQASLATAYASLQGYTGAETAEAFRGAAKLVERFRESEAAFPVYLGLHAFHVVRGEFHLSAEIAATSLKLARKLPTIQPLIFSLYVSGLNQFFLGNLIESKKWQEQAVEISERERPDPVASVYGEEPTVSCRCILSILLGILGYPEASRSLAMDAHERAKGVGHANSLAYSFMMHGIVHRIRRDWDAMLCNAHGMVALIDEQRLPMWAPWARCQIGLAKAATGNVEEGCDLVAASAEDSLAAGPLWAPLQFATLAEALGMRGLYERSFQALDRATTFAEQTEELWWLPETHRVCGAIHAMVGDKERAERSFEVAISEARHREARWFELRAARDLAQLWRDQGRTREAHNLLAPVYGWFTEGFDTPDLIEARALLEELGG